MKRIIYLLITAISLAACEKECESGPDIIPVDGYWRLEKIESSSRTIQSKDFGYKEILKFDSGGSTTLMLKFRDGKQVDMANFRSPTDADYRDGSIYAEAVVGARFMKMELSGGSMLILSDLLYTNSPDTVRYYYYKADGL